MNFSECFSGQLNVDLNEIWETDKYQINFVSLREIRTIREAEDILKKAILKYHIGCGHSVIHPLYTN